VAVRGDRPLGVTLLSLWSVVVGSAILAAAAYYIYVRLEIPRPLFDMFRGFPDALVAIAAVVLGFHLLTAYGLWNLKPWGRFLAYALALLGVAVGMLTLPFGMIGVVVSLTTAWYLTEHKTRALFRNPRASNAK